MAENVMSAVTIHDNFDSYSPPRDCGDEKCRDFFMEFIYICVIPTSILLLLTFILSICFCCSKSTRSKKSISEEEQLRYDTIRRASKTLRRMSYTRDTPLLDDRYGTMTLDRSDRNRHGFRSRDSCYSAPGTLQRHRNRQSTYSSQQSLPPPPVYRLPPNYPDDDRSTQENNIPMVDLPNNQGLLQIDHAGHINGPRQQLDHVGHGINPQQQLHHIGHGNDPVLQLHHIGHGNDPQQQLHHIGHGNDPQQQLHHIGHGNDPVLQFDNASHGATNNGFVAQ